MHTDDSVLTERINGARDLKEIHEACHEITHALGFESFLYCVHIPVSLTRPYQFILSGYPKQWRERYDEQQYLAIDPVMAHARNSLIPLVWADIEQGTTQVRQLFWEAADFGLHHGLTLPVHGRAGEASCLSFSGRTSLPDNSHARLDVMRRAQWFGMYIHETVRRIALTRANLPQEDNPLTRREKECLRWASDGKTSWEIGTILGISERTAVFHLNNAAKKLGVQSRAHSIARAISLGHLTPVEISSRLDQG